MAEPKDRTGLCRSIIKFGDDFGDNCITFRCDLPLAHDGKHIERGDMGYGEEHIPYTLEWEGGQEEDEQKTDEDF